MVVLDEDQLVTMRTYGLSILEGGGNRLRVVQGIFRGVYNDYGWLEGVKPMPTDDIGHQPPCIFFHEAICLTLDLEPWQRIDNYLELGSVFDRELKVTPELKDFVKVCIHAGNLRRDVLGTLKFQGHQELIGDQVKFDLNTKQREILEHQHKRFDENEDERE